MKHKNGFTLLELSIVLVVIGLISGGIIIGQSLVRQAQLRAAVSEYDTYLKAFKEFQDKYLALPGDMNNATSIWTTEATANGDGNGMIGTGTTTGLSSNTAGTGGINGIVNPTEWFLAWQHLALAGFIPGKYSGGGNMAIAGVNVPASKLSGAGWSILYYMNTSSHANGAWGDQYGHIFAFGGNPNGMGMGFSAMNIIDVIAPPAEASEFGWVPVDFSAGGVLTPAEASDIDSKLDDGMPGTGKIRAWRTNFISNCTCNDSSQTNQAYNSSSVAGCTNYTGKACSIFFLPGF